MNHLKKNAPYITVGFVVCGLVGYFLGGSDGRALGSGVGVFIGFIVGGLVGSVFTNK